MKYDLNIQSSPINPINFFSVILQLLRVMRNIQQNNIIIKSNNPEVLPHTVTFMRNTDFPHSH